MTIRFLDLLLAGARLAASLLRPLLLAGCYGDGPLQPIARLLTLEQSWAEEGYATFATDNVPSSTAGFLDGDAFTKEVRCSQRPS
ncbi:hypothetical protein [Streptomyces graminilatus]|uniref:hypothetical protein n=1 Tax=Streptomyces graminilatus TaxID=1464070 RepID=UPI0006E43CA3|nr:hypothetical protein [Streptomyces graminilatus]